MRKSLLILTFSLFGGGSLAQGAPTTLTFNFYPGNVSGTARNPTSCSNTASACESNAFTPTQTFTTDGVSIVASGFYNGNASNLSWKNQGSSPSELGLGLYNDSTGDGEIPYSGAGLSSNDFVQLNISSLIGTNLKTFSMTFSSVTASEGWAVYETNTACTSHCTLSSLSATLLMSGGPSTDGVAKTFTTLPTDKYLDVIETSPPTSNNILIESLSATVTPEPASMLLFGTGLLCIGFAMRRKLFV